MSETKNVVLETVALAGFGVYVPLSVYASMTASGPPPAIIIAAAATAVLFYLTGAYLRFRIRPGISQAREAVFFLDAVSGFFIVTAIMLIPLISRLFSTIPGKKGQPASLMYTMYAIILVLALMVVWMGGRWMWARARTETAKDVRTDD